MQSRQYRRNCNRSITMNSFKQKLAIAAAIFTLGGVAFGANAANAADGKVSTECTVVQKSANSSKTLDGPFEQYSAANSLG
jgi:hypothetical protein